MAGPVLSAGGRHKRVPVYQTGTSRNQRINKELAMTTQQLIRASKALQRISYTKYAKGVSQEYMALANFAEIMEPLLTARGNSREFEQALSLLHIKGRAAAEYAKRRNVSFPECLDIVLPEDAKAETGGAK